MKLIFLAQMCLHSNVVSCMNACLQQPLFRNYSSKFRLFEIAIYKVRNRS